MSASWSISSKHALMSASSTHNVPRLAPRRTASRAWWAEAGSEPVARLQEIGLEHRLEDDLGGGHDHPVTDGGDAEGPGCPRLPGLGDVDPPQWPGTVLIRPQLVGQSFEELSHPGLLNGVDGDAVDTRCALVGTDLAPRPPQDVAAGDLVEQGVEPSGGCPD